jgi:hypothetical protein
MLQGMSGTDWADCKRRETQQREDQKRWQMRPNLRRSQRESRSFASGFNDAINRLISRDYFIISKFRILAVAGRPRPELNHWNRTSRRAAAVPIPLKRKKAVR